MYSYRTEVQRDAGKRKESAVAILLGLMWKGVVAILLRLMF